MSYGSFEWALRDWSTGRGVERRSERFSVGGHRLRAALDGKVQQYHMTSLRLQG